MSRRGKPNSDGDWMDALKEAMKIDPALRKKREDRPAPTFGHHPQGMPEVVADLLAEEGGRKPRPDPATEFPWASRKRPGEEAAADKGFTPPPPPPVVAPPPPPEALPVVAPSAPPPPITPASLTLDDEFPPPPAVYADDRAAGSTPSQRLVDGVEPLLQLICRLNRMKRTGETSDRFRPDAVRVEIESALDRVASVGPAGAALIEPLQGFADVVITRANFPFARRWQPLATGGAPDKIFLSAAVAASANPAGKTDGTWAVFHACLALTADLLPAVDGLPAGTELLDQLDAELYAVPVERICPTAYDGVFDHAILPSVGNRLRMIAAVSVGLLLLAVAAALVLNLLYLQQMGRSIDSVAPALLTQSK